MKGPATRPQESSVRDAWEGTACLLSLTLSYQTPPTTACSSTCPCTRWATPHEGSCRRAEDGDGHNAVSIVHVPLAAPASATAMKHMLDAGTAPATYPLQNTTFTFRACHT